MNKNDNPKTYRLLSLFKYISNIFLFMDFVGVSAENPHETTLVL